MFDTIAILRNGTAEMHVRETGEGAPLLMIHGFGSSMDTWQLTVPALAKEHRLLVPDLPGHGRSTKTIETPALEYFCTWLVRLLDERGIAQTDVMGHSMGGRISLHLALTRPERIRKLVLVDSGGLGRNNSNFRARMNAVQTQEDLREAWGMAYHNPKLITETALKARMRLLQDPQVRECQQQIAADTTETGGYNFDFTPLLPKIQHTTLVLWGREDRIAPLANGERTRAIPHSRLVVFDACGHSPQIEAQPAFNKAVVEFLREA
jgi:pimeloyl-ACP methyl ester carboxylesterase